mmetsp:Transcript_82184/g.227998  ORF Transcript_82184/g.227998 Transcript_82184/m.227998 type:complete len:224 (-) Transcript_82184:241-912(-)
MCSGGRPSPAQVATSTMATRPTSARPRSSCRGQGSSCVPKATSARSLPGGAPSAGTADGLAVRLPTSATLEGWALARAAASSGSTKRGVPCRASICTWLPKYSPHERPPLESLVPLTSWCVPARSQEASHTAAKRALRRTSAAPRPAERPWCSQAALAASGSLAHCKCREGRLSSLASSGYNASTTARSKWRTRNQGSACSNSCALTSCDKRWKLSPARKRAE